MSTSHNITAKYRKWSALQQDLPLFARDWWWDAVCGDNQWNVVYVQHGEQEYALPYYRLVSRFVPFVTQPPWTQYSPILDLARSGTDSFRQHVEGTVLAKILKTMPGYAMTEINLAPGYSMGEPVPVSRLKVSRRRTRHIQPMSRDELEKGYSKNLLRNLKSAQEAYTIETFDDASAFFIFVMQALRKKNGRFPFNAGPGIRLAEALADRGLGQITIARDQQGKMVAGILTGWDGIFTYYIIGGQITPQGSPSAHSILMHRAIVQSHEQGRTFDFCGSMIPGVMRFFRSFGGSEKTFLQLSRNRGLAAQYRNLKRRLR